MFDGDAAGVEGDALAYEAHRLFLFASGSVPAHHEQPRWFDRALRHAQQRTHAQLRHILFVEYGDFDAQILQMLAAFNKAFRVDDVGGLADQFLGQRYAVGNRSIFRPQLFSFDRCADNSQGGDGRL
jgi:hypothetical protein